MDDSLYREELMEIYKNSKNRGSLRSPSVSVSEKNPMCGDELTVQLNVENGVITEAKFDGMACAVSIISSEIFLNSLEGKSLEYAESLTKDELLEMVGLNLTTSRIKCASLVLEATKNAIKKYKEENH
jgi:nitrogen fixation NifU-like protein